jgi:hypothetical protein
MAKFEGKSGIASYGVLLSLVLSYFMNGKSLGPQDQSGWHTQISRLGELYESLPLSAKTQR